MGVTVPQELAGSFNGSLLLPGDAGYDDVRAVHNGLVDKRPGVIARCHNVADVRDAVNFGRESGLEISVRGGGHNVAGRAVTEGGLMIDLSLMRGVDVDPARRRARAQGGVTWNEYNRATNVYGQATTGGVISTTGVAGLTLGGGLGWLMGTARPGHRQRHPGRGGDGRRSGAHRQRRERARSVLGAARWRRQLRGRRLLRVRDPSARHHPRRAARAPVGGRGRGVRHVPPVHQGAARRGHRLLRTRARPGRQRDEAVRRFRSAMPATWPRRRRTWRRCGRSGRRPWTSSSRCRTRS